MRKGNMMILASIFVMALVASVVSVGTQAWFSDTRTSSDNKFTSGTLILQIANEGGTYGNGVTATWSSPAGWAPGQSFTSTIYLKNTGSVDAMAVYTDWAAGSLNDPNGLSNWIQVTEIRDSTDNYASNAIPAPAAVDLNGDGKVSLAELASWSERNISADPGDMKTTGWPVTAPALAANGGTLGIRYTFKLMDLTPNTMQDRTCYINVVLTASQIEMP
jgi:predicted ribosomally synthesized peptide with SipW-like signal peptide